MSNQYKIHWERHDRRPGVWLKITSESFEVTHSTLDESLDEVGRWCRDNRCGQRKSYDLWQFKNETEMTMFLLRWS